MNPNPWIKSTWNVTTQFKVISSNPTLARQLQDEAQAIERREALARPPVPIARREVIRALASAVAHHTDKGFATDGDLRAATSRLCSDAEHAAALRVLESTAGRNAQGRWVPHSYVGLR